MGVVDSADFDNVVSDIGETVTIYNPSQTLSTDYGSVVTDGGLSGGTSETAIIQPESLHRISMSEGKLQVGDLLAMFKSDSVIGEDKLVTRGSNLYKVKNLIEVRPGGSVHHYECNLEFVRTTS